MLKTDINMNVWPNWLYWKKTKYLALSVFYGGIKLTLCEIFSFMTSALRMGFDSYVSRAARSGLAIEEYISQYISLIPP